MADKDGYDDPLWKRSSRRVGEVGGAVVRGPQADVREIFKLPFAPVVGVIRWLFYFIAIALGFTLLFVGILFVYNVTTQGVSDVVFAETYNSLRNFPLFSKILPVIQQGREIVVNPADVVEKSSSNQWKATVDATETDKEIGLAFVNRPSSDRNIYFPNERILLDADLAIKIPKEEGLEEEKIMVSFGCLGESNDETIQGIVKPSNKEINEGELSSIHITCEFSPNTFTVDSDTELQPVKVKMFVDYEFSSYSFWEVYTKSEESLRQDRLLGRDTFSGYFDSEGYVNSVYIRDRAKGIVASQPSKAPVKISLGGIGQPYTEIGTTEDGFNFLGVSLDKYARYSPINGAVRQIEDVRIRIPYNFVLNTDEGDFIESEEDADELDRKEYKIKQEKLAEFNSRCARLGIEKEENGFLSQKCFDALSDEEFSMRSLFKVDYLETEDLSVSEITAKADYVYETYDTTIVNLRKVKEVIA